MGPALNASRKFCYSKKFLKPLDSAFQQVSDECILSKKKHKTAEYLWKSKWSTTDRQIGQSEVQGWLGTLKMQNWEQKL